MNECPDCSSGKDTPITWTFCLRCTERRLTREAMAKAKTLDDLAEERDRLADAYYSAQDDADMYQDMAADWRRLATNLADGVIGLLGRMNQHWGPGARTATSADSRKHYDEIVQAVRAIECADALRVGIAERELGERFPGLVSADDTPFRMPEGGTDS